MENNIALVNIIAECIHGDVNLLRIALEHNSPQEAIHFILDDLEKQAEMLERHFPSTTPGQRKN